MVNPEGTSLIESDVIDIDYSYGDDTSDIPEKLITLSQKPNLIDEFGDSVQDVENQINEQFQSDEAEMEDWLQKSENALKLASMQSDGQKKDFPIEGASKVMAPFLMEAAIEFNSRLNLDVLSSNTPASFSVVGQDTDDKKADRAERVKDFFNATLLKSTWSEESDQESMALPIVGTTYKKVFWNERSKVVESYYLPADKVIFSQQHSFDKAPQHSEKVSYSKNELVGFVNAGIFDIELDDLGDEDEWEGFEAHFYYDFDDDGYSEPYIAVYLNDIGIVRIRAGFLPEDVRSHEGKVTHIDRKEYYAQKKLLSDPSGSPMGIGFGILLNDTYETINTNLRQLIDAGTLQNTSANSGLIANTTSPMMGADNRMSEGPIELEMGKLKKVTVSSGQSLAQSVVQMPFKGPSPVLLQLLQYVDEAARRMTTVSYNVDANPGEAASLYMAKLGQSMKTYNAMMYRVYRGLTKEFKLIFRCMFEHAEDLQGEYATVLDEKSDMAADFNPKDCDILPTANPSNGSDIERVAKAEIVIQSIPQNPQINQRKAWLDYYEALGIEELEQLMPEQEGPTDQEKQQAAFAAMQAEFENRKLQIGERELQQKERRLMLDEMEMQVKTLNMAQEAEQKAIKNAADVDNTMADTLKKLTETSIEKINAYMAALDRYEQNLTTGDTNEERSGGAMVDGPDNAGVLGLP